MSGPTRGRGVRWLLVPVIVAGLLLWARRHEADPAYFARGYVEGARAMIDSQYVRLDCDSMRITTHFPAGSDAERWFSLSYLREDVRRFNSDPNRVPGPFVIDYDECRLEGVDRYYHRIELPFSPNLAWRGDVLLAGGRRSAVLENRSIPQTIELRPPADLHDAGTERGGSPQQPVTYPPTALFQMRASPGGALLSELYFVGEDLVLADRRREGLPFQIRVGGYPLYDGRVVRIETGDWIQFAPTGPARPGGAAPPVRPAPTYLARVGSDNRLASFVRVQNDEVDRLYPIDYLRPFVAPFTQAMSTARQAGATRGAEVDSVVLTLHRDLGEELHRSVSAWCRTVPRRSNRPRSVSMLVMDAFSGAVRAIPSCPTEAELSALAGLSPADRERLLRNQNLVRHEIGSAGKPFWTAALASTYPNLLDLQVEGHSEGPIASVLGCPLPAPYSDHAHGGLGTWVGLEAFLSNSCNRYIVEMATGALTLSERAQSGRLCTERLDAADFRSCFATPGPTDSAGSLRVCDGLVRTVLSADSRFVAQDCNHLKLISSDFRPVPALGRITNVEWFHRGAPDRLLEGRGGGGEGQPGSRAGYEFGRYRTAVWQRVTDALSPGGSGSLAVETGLRFAAVSPEEANLQLNKVQELRPDWISVLLGGATSRWSNFQLAEALSRLVTGRTVVGEFVDSVRVPRLGGRADVNGRRLFPAMPATTLDDGVRRRVLHGMELVAESGTARVLFGRTAALRDSLARAVPGEPYELYVFAKTGTPTVSKHVSSGGQQMVRDLMRYLRWDAATSRIVIAPGGDRILRRPGRNAAYWARWFEQEVREPLETDPSLFEVLPGQAPPNHPLYLMRGQLRMNVRKDVEVTGQGGVLVLGLLAVPHSQGRAVSQGLYAWTSACPDPALQSRILAVPPTNLLDPSSAVGLSVAIFVDDLPLGQGSGRAVDLANRSMDQLGRYLLAQVREKARARTGVRRPAVP